MKNKILLFLGCCIMAVSCNGDDYNDSALWDKVGDLDNRVSSLEQLCKEMNTNISSLQTIVSALQTGDYITSITPITRDGANIGYTISFQNSPSITIYHGENGKDGNNGNDGKDGENGKDGQNGITPTIGIAKYTDDNYYWTIKFGSLPIEWLKDSQGLMVRANGIDGKDGADGEDGTDGKDGVDGKDGEDGITPKLKIEDEYWYVSTDNGATWAQLGYAKGEAGENGDSFFQDVINGDDSVTFMLANGETIVIPKSTSASTNLSFENPTGFASGETKSVPYILANNNASITIVGALLDWEIIDDRENSQFLITAPIGVSGSNRVEVALLVSDGGRIDSYPMTLIIANDALSVLIAGTVWAKSNLSDTYTFAINPGEWGTYFARNSNYSLSYGHLPSANNQAVSGKVWDEAKDPCPEGWRIPAQEDFEALIASGYKKVKASADNWNTYGIWFGPSAQVATSSNPGNSIFLPAARFKTQYEHAHLWTANSTVYWSRTNYRQTFKNYIALEDTAYPSWEESKPTLEVTAHSENYPACPIRCVKN